MFYSKLLPTFLVSCILFSVDGIEMGLTPEEIKALLEDWSSKFGQGYAAKDAQKLAACFDPEGVIIEAGDQAYYGHDALVKYYSEFLTNGWTFEGISDHHWSATNEAEYLIHSNNAIVVKPDGTKKARRQEAIFKRQPDGTYLMYSQLLKWL